MVALFLDANVPMYAAGGPHPYKEPCARIIVAISTGDLECVSSAEVVQEILHRYISIGSRPQAIDLAGQFLALLPRGILSVGRREMVEALGLAATFPVLRGRDAVHAATMRTNGLTGILSADRHFDHLPGITRYDPVVFAATLPA